MTVTDRGVAQAPISSRTSILSLRRNEILQLRERVLVGAAGIFYAIAMQKYATRDGLSSSTGVQGYIELVGVVGAFACILVASGGATQRFKPALPPLCFSVFGLFALASSWRSFSPSLSLVKGLLLLCVMASGYLAAQAGVAQRYFRSIYWSYVGVLVIGLLVGILFPHNFPLFEIDAFSGRTKMSVFATHPGVVSECCAVLIFVAALLDKKPHWISVVFLLAINIAAGEKTSTGCLIAFLLLRFFWRYDRVKSWRTLAIVVTVMAASIAGTYLYLAKLDLSGGSVAAVATSVYGSNFSTEANTLNGRTVLWRGAIRLLGDAQVIGYGVDGAREMLIHIEPWSGQSHNGFIEVALESGLVGASFFIFGLAGIVRACVMAHPAIRKLIVPLLGYILANATLGSIFSSPINFGLLCLVWLFYLARSSVKGVTSASSSYTIPPALSTHSQNI